MPLISVCLTPVLANLQTFADKVVVVVDILRATTSIITALEFGVKSILPVESVQQCRNFQNMGYIGAAERGGKIVEGFKLGNSPFDYLNPCYTGKKIALTTTNGTKTIYAIGQAKRIVFGAFVNLNAIINLLIDQKQDTVIICAGWEGEVNLEDTLFAGALIDHLNPSYTPEGDPAILSQKLFQQAKGNLIQFLEGSSHIRRLQNLGLQKDIDFCLSLDKYEIVPELINGEIIPLKNVC